MRGSPMTSSGPSALAKIGQVKIAPTTAFTKKLVGCYLHIKNCKSYVQYHSSGTGPDI